MRKEFARNIKSLESVFDFLHEFMSLQQMTGTTRENVDLVVEELFTNMVRHGQENSKNITITLRNSENELSIEMEEPASIPFDITAAPEPKLDLPLEERKPGGLGIVLVRRLSDSLRHEYREGKNIITVTKRLE